jgi:formate C-acetyltransferase
LPVDEGQRSGENVYWAGWGGHAILGYESVLRGGTEALRKRVRRYNEGETDPGRRVFRQALLVVCDGIDAFAANYAAAAGVLLDAGACPPDQRALLEQVRDVCHRVPNRGARSFVEALQSFFFIHLLDGADSPGRFDQYLGPYLDRDLERGVLDLDSARRWLHRLWQRFHELGSWNLCIGGVRPDGSDAANALTRLVLDVASERSQPHPNLSLRLHAGSPDDVRERAFAVLSGGYGMPALYNDEVIVPALARMGIPREEARDYAMNGCSQIDIQGRSHMGLEDGELNLLKCLELALNNGVDPRQGCRIGPETGDPLGFGSYDEFWQAYTRQVEFFTDRLTAAANAMQQAHAETSPNLLRSLFVDDCIASGTDFKAGGARHNHGQILTQGIANTADSLAVLKVLVFERRRLGLEELLEHLRQDFPDERLRRMLLNSVAKFGNDDSGVDAIAAEVVRHFYTCLNRFRTWRGGRYGGGAIVFVRGVSFGRHVGATPDGRRAGTPLADSVGPAHGRDRLGPTAMLRSVARIPQELALSAYVLNAKFSRSFFAQNRDRIARLVEGYFREGGQQIQINCVDEAELLAAQVHPEDHSDLIVRVGGYSEYFTRLSRELQDDVIARTCAAGA